MFLLPFYPGLLPQSKKIFYAIGKKIMRWQEVYRILPLLVGAYDVVRASIDCDDDTLVKLGDANDNDGLAH